MSLTCYCPRCTTAFLVSEQQLGEAQGWVRCGICQEVFMAQAHTIAPPPTLATEQPVLPSQPPEPLASDEPRLEAESLYEPSSILEDEYATAPETPKPPTRQQTRWGWFAVGALAVALLVQLGFHERQRLLNLAPKAAASLQALCPGERCRLRNLAALSIDNSSFSAVGTHLFHLQAVVGNPSELAVESPLLALTLTDSSDRVVARRRYPPQDWGSAGASLAGGSATPLSLWIEWNGPPGGPRVVGYRIQAFYPE